MRHSFVNKMSIKRPIYRLVIKLNIVNIFFHKIYNKYSITEVGGGAMRIMMMANSLQNTIVTFAVFPGLSTQSD